MVVIALPPSPILPTCQEGVNMAETDGAFVTLVGGIIVGLLGAWGKGGTVSGRINRLCRNVQTTLLMNSDKDLMKQNTGRQ